MSSPLLDYRDGFAIPSSIDSLGITKAREMYVESDQYTGTSIW
jgi:hypothetical protein